MTAPLFELTVPLKTLGESEATGAFKRIEAAGKQASATLEQSTRQGVQKAKGELDKLTPQVAAALVNAKGNVNKAGQTLATELTLGFRRQFVRSRAEIQEEVARGLITPQQAQQRGREAAQAFNRGVLGVISTQGAASGLQGRAGGALFVNLAGQLKSVDQAAVNAGRGGIRALTSNLAQLAAMELGVRSGLGTFTSVLGTMAFGATLTLGVTAGLAAIAFAFGQVAKAAKESEEATKKAADAFHKSVDEIRALRAEQMPLGTAEKAVTEAGDALKVQTDRNTLAQKNLTKATEDMLAAQQRMNKARREGGRFVAVEAAAIEKAQAALTEARQAATRADLDRQTAANQLTIAEANLAKTRTDASDKAHGERTKEIQQLTALIGIGRATAADLERREALIRENTKALKADNLSLDDRARLEQEIITLRTAGEKSQKAAIKTTQEHIQALAALASAGIATSDDLAELATIQNRLSAATKVGSAEARAQAQALLQVVEAARLAGLELEKKLRLDQLKPKMSKTSPPGSLVPRRVEPRQTKEDLQKQGFVTEFPTAGFAAAFDALPEQTRNMIAATEALTAFRDDMAGLAMDMVSLPSILQLGADAWLAFWDALGSGEGLGESIAKLFSGISRYFAKYFAAKALAAAADALLPPPLGNPAAAAAIPLYLAASAAFAALGGAAGGGARSASRGGGTGRGQGFDRSPVETTTRIEPRLRGPAFAVQAGRIQPIQPVTFNGTFYGTDRDPKVQDWLSKNIKAATQRGLLR